VTKDMQPIEIKLAQYTTLDELLRRALHHPMNAEHRAQGLAAIRELVELLGLEAAVPPVPMILTCPSCNVRHIDEGEFATKPHHTHACQGCGMVWRPAKIATVGVQFLPGFRNP
jgi:hypothetical protein